MAFLVAVMLTLSGGTKKADRDMHMFRHMVETMFAAGTSNEPLFRRRDHFVLYEGRTVDFMVVSILFSDLRRRRGCLLSAGCQFILNFQIRTLKIKIGLPGPGVVFSG